MENHPSMNKEPCLDVEIPQELVDFATALSRVEYYLEQHNRVMDHESPSLSMQYLPSHVTNAVGCAQHQIESLQDVMENQQHPIHPDDEDALDDGFFLCDLNVVFQKLVAWRRLFPRIKPFYALKCNPDPMVAAVLRAATDNARVTHSGVGFDCASIPEIELALNISSSDHNSSSSSSSNQPSKNVVYANPQRAEKDLETALVKYKVRVLTFDGPEELYKIHRIYQQELNKQKNEGEDNKVTTRTIQVPQLVLRILVPDEQSSVPLGEKFGVPPDNVPTLVKLAAEELKLPIIGVSFHCGSGNHDPASYATAIQLANEAIHTIDQIQRPLNLAPCWLCDIGGGYPGKDGMGASQGRFCGIPMAAGVVEEVPPPPQLESEDTAAKIAEVVAPLIDELFPASRNANDDDESSSAAAGSTNCPIHIISEPGRYFVEEAFCLCCRIYGMRIDHDDDEGENKKSTVRRHYFIAHGTQGVFKDVLLCGETFTPSPLQMTKQKEEGEKQLLIPSTVHGPSGEAYDIVCPDIMLPELNIGDWLVFDRVGAYTLSIAARSGQPPVRYVVGGTCATTSL
eukprot:CAMPEP_0168728484 /NCGR_PEP_ID=MMETSP0724-20121128/5706_1 /TAXON_ID=265536 /ORGANISM="Amphiprora sp., Strain CCMP467" /LENGTH=568 /DNA_ID=CAMNT_0008775327 /DNA_START=162 /DNA_END=1868 /DNA_ORIENTATION=+